MGLNSRGRLLASGVGFLHAGFEVLDVGGRQLGWVVLDRQLFELVETVGSIQCEGAGVRMQSVCAPLKLENTFPILLHADDSPAALVRSFHSQRGTRRWVRWQRPHMARLGWNTNPDLFQSSRWDGWVLFSHCVAGANPVLFGRCNRIRMAWQL